MPKYRVFVDGAAGTTGLCIRERLAARKDIELVVLAEEERKDFGARFAALTSADVSILCLPDDAARELVAAAPAAARICDTSTAHRTAPGWVYGFPELGVRRSELAGANRVAVPGCHASGFLALITPLVEKSALAPGVPLTCQSITGYSGGGKSMIAAYEAPSRPAEYEAPRLYGLGLAHKHLPEMQVVAGLACPPLFTPVVADFYSGMLVTVPLPVSALGKGFQSAEALHALYTDYYRGAPLIALHAPGEAPPNGTLSACARSGADDMELFLLGNAQQLLLAARYDNLGKGASGAAVQCMNLMLGLPETDGLVL